MATGSPRRPSEWALTGVMFAAVMLMLVGIFQFFAGLAAIINDDFYVKTAHYTYDLDVTAWGWIHLVIGIVVFLAGLGLFSGKLWAGITAIFIACLSAFANFLFIPYYPFWSILMIAIDVWVIWSLTRPGVFD